MFSYKRQKTITIVTFLIIPLILLLGFSYFPAIKLFQFSFTDWDGISKTFKYIGLQNYKEIFEDNTAVETLINNIAYVLAVLVQVSLGLYFAIILDSNIRAKKFFRSAVFMPYILNGMAVAFMFNYMYNYDDGPINMVLRALGLGKYAIHFLSDTWSSNLSLAFLLIWKCTGFTMVVFLGALQSIPKEQYEAASIDGSNFFQNIRYIALPSIKPVVVINLFLSLNGALQAFFEPFILTQGGPGIRTATFALNAYYQAFRFNNFGIASALGVFLLLIIIVVMIFQKAVIGGGED